MQTNKLLLIISLFCLACGVENTIHPDSSGKEVVTIPTCNVDQDNVAISVTCSDGTLVIVDNSTTTTNIISLPSNDTVDPEEEICTEHNKQKKDKFCQKHPWHKHCEETE